LFVTTANLTTNPRLLKELKSLNTQYHCFFLGFKLRNWSDEIDNSLRSELKGVSFKYLSATRKPLVLWVFASFYQILSRWIFPFPKRVISINAFASDKRSFLLHWYLSKKKEKKFDLIISHNIGALYPAYKYAEKHKIPFAFDIEDYHPGEKIQTDKKNEKKRREFLMQELLPKAAYISYASPLIGSRSLNLIGVDKIKEHLLINNVFDSSEFKHSSDLTGDLKLCWFSQYVDKGRGLEDVLTILDNNSHEIELHLIGNIRSEFKNVYLIPREYIVLHGTMPQKEIHKELQYFDVGLSLENPGWDLNRDICLTNKVWAYMQAGLFIIATETSAQKNFIKTFPWAGVNIKNDFHDFDRCLKWMIKNKYSIRKGRKKRFSYAKKIDINLEMAKLIETVNHIIN